MIKINSTNIYLVDNTTTHTILKSKIYFTHLIIKEASVNTIIGNTKMMKAPKELPFYFLKNLFRVLNIFVSSGRVIILFLEETYYVLKFL